MLKKISVLLAVSLLEKFRLGRVEYVAIGYFRRQENTKDGTRWCFGARAVNDAAAVLFDDTARDPQAQAGAMRLLGSDERREETLANLRRYTGAAIDDKT